MLILSAIIYLGLYLHTALAGATLHVNDATLAVPDQSAGSFVSAKFDVGDATTLTYGCDADGFAVAGSAWRVLPGDEWDTTVTLSADGYAVNDVAGGQEYAWMEVVVLPEPGVWGVVAWGLVGRRKR